MQLAALPGVETCPAHCPRSDPMLAATKRSTSNVLLVIRPVRGCLNELTAGAPIEPLGSPAEYFGLRTEVVFIFDFS